MAAAAGAADAELRREVEALRGEVAALRKSAEVSRKENLLLRSRVAELEARPAAGGGRPPRAAGRAPAIGEEERRALLRHLREEASVHLGPSTIAGVGVFAFREIAEGVDPFEVCNAHLAAEERFITFSGAEIRDFAEPVRERVKEFFAPLTEEDGWTPQQDESGEPTYGVLATGLNSLNISWFLNHSDEPNVVFKDAEDEGSFNTYVTRRRIRAGEELTADYRELGREYHALVARGS
ncbi:unnamed protein product [Prorocentrum cordatum]|uniref:SET domain-containing protein n=1 Tax=Prorocentrum cordatum TaxID=2364126 RepID=A0ABN9UKS1_9DINO|nr:unnamed protein product [Polarella glacialis]